MTYKIVEDDGRLYRARKVQPIRIYPGFVLCGVLDNSGKQIYKECFYKEQLI